MEGKILEAIYHVKSISKKNLSYKNILSYIQKFQHWLRSNRENSIGYGHEKKSLIKTYKNYNYYKEL